MQKTLIIGCSIQTEEILSTKFRLITNPTFLFKSLGRIAAAAKKQFTSSMPILRSTRISKVMRLMKALRSNVEGASKNTRLIKKISKIYKGKISWCFSKGKNSLSHMTKYFYGITTRSSFTHSNSNFAGRTDIVLGLKSQNQRSTAILREYQPKTVQTTLLS